MPDTTSETTLGIEPAAPPRSEGTAAGPAVGPAKVIDFRRYRLARLINDASVQQGELARMMRASANERTQLAEALQGAQRHLATIADSYTHLLTRLAREKDFRTACQEAAELDDLEEMIRRRDALASELADIRRTARPGLRIGLIAGGEAQS